MNIKNILKISFGVAALVTTQMSCINDDKWDAPEIVCNNKFDAPTISMADFVALSPAAGVYTVPTDGAPVIFDGYVVSSDANGNFYKTISFQDKPENPTIGLVVGINKSLNYADFPVGAHIRIKANGMVIGKSNDVVTLGVKDPDFTIGRIPESIIGRFIAGVCNGNGLDIANIVPQELASLGDVKKTRYINTLVTVKNVQFIAGDVGKGLMEKDLSGAFVDTNRTIVDQYGATAIIRTDGFFKPSSYVIPDAHGTITFVASKYGTSSTSWQNVLRGTSDINFTTPGRLTPATTAFNEEFPANYLTANGWTAYNAAGPQVWGSTNFGNPAPSAYISGLGAVNEDWLISKSISLTGYSAAKFYFESDVRYAGNPLEVYVTTDAYTGGNPSGLSWTKLDAYVDADIVSFGGFVGSGLVDLAPYLNKNVRFAFKYSTPSASVGSAVEIDNVKVYVIP